MHHLQDRLVVELTVLGMDPDLLTLGDPGIERPSMSHLRKGTRMVAGPSSGAGRTTASRGCAPELDLV